MTNTANWIIGGVVALLGLTGLFLAAHGLDDGVYLFGLGLFAFAVLFLFSLIGRTVGRRDAGGEPPEPAEQRPR